MHTTHMTVKTDKPDLPVDDLFRTSVLLSRSDLRKLKVVEAIEGKGRDEVIRGLIAERVADVDLRAAA